MKGLSIRNIIKVTGGTLKGNFKEELLDKEVSGVFIDSRKCIEDCLFIPTVGARVDGHDFIEGVYEKKALMVLSERDLDIDKPYILIKDSFIALKQIAEEYREHINAKIIGVVGSVGKTSTKESIASALKPAFKVYKTKGNLNNEVGVPLSLLEIRDDDQIAVLEMGISDFGEMHRLSKIAKPDYVVMTNIGTCHLENLHDRDGVLEAKSEVFDFIKDDGKIILNGDDDKLCTITEKKGIKPIFYGTNSKLDAYADELKANGFLGTTFKANFDGKSFSVTVPVPGLHMVYNAMAAVVCGCLLGMKEEEISEGIGELQTISGRNNFIKTDKITIIDDCYNANPMSMKASLSVLDNAEGRTVAILGDMFELGEDEASLHYEVGLEAKKLGTDVIVAVGELSKNIYDGAVTDESGKSYFYFKTKEEMLGEIKNVIQEGDTVLVKASHGMGFSEVVEALKEI